MDTNQLREVWQRLHDFCAEHEWSGYDPYDGLNSPLAGVLPGKAARQAWTQFHRRSPLNFRPLCRIRPTLNPKALALFAMGSSAMGLHDEATQLLRRLEAARGADGGWGYPFHWQSRAFFAPRGMSNLICTAFAANAFRALGGTCDFSYIEKHLLRERDGKRWITYVADSDTQVHNINMIGAALLHRRDCMEFSVKRQQVDGSWWYGEAENQHWIDNFHTGYCLAALKDYAAATGDGGFAENAQRGFKYWDKTFWEEDGAPRYYHNQPYPLDCHCSAQGVLTYLAFGERDKANRAAQWALENMWDERGFFWYQQGRWITNRVCYMRWTQAWMYCALAKLIKANETANP